MTDWLRDHIAEIIVGSLLGQAEKRGDYAVYDFDPSDPTSNLVHLDTSIDPFGVADTLLGELNINTVVEFVAFVGVVPK